MTNENIIINLKKIFEEVFQDNNITITRELTANDVDNWDSLRHVEMIGEVEKFFGIKLKLREIMKMKNVGDLIDLIHSNTNK